MELNVERAYLTSLDDRQVGSATQGSLPVSSRHIAIVPVVLSGGGGSRLWPCSTKDRPKQFLPIVDDKTLFEQALDRVRDAERFTAPIIVTSIHHAELCERQLGRLGKSARLILEPCARNTAPAIVMAAVVAKELHGDDALILVMPSDHIIEDVPAFHDAVRSGAVAASAGRLVTFGIRPSAPETGYGYLLAGEEIACAPGVKDVRRFIEKPGIEAAEAMVAAGDHLWNAGIFLLPVGAFVDEAERTCPAIAGAAREAVLRGKRDGMRIVPNADVLQACPAQSIDYAIMELSSRVAVVPMSPGWSDVGSWDAIAALARGTAQTGPVTTLDCENCYIRSDGIEVAALGVRDLIIVASAGKLLILPRGRSQDVKRLLSTMDLVVA